MKYNIISSLFHFVFSPMRNDRQSTADWLFSRTVMTKWLNYDSVVIHANFWRLLQPRECSIIGATSLIFFWRFSFAARRHAAPAKWNILFFHAIRSKLEQRRDAVIAKTTGVLFSIESRINLRYRRVAFDTCVQPFLSLFTLDRLIFAGKPKGYNIHGSKVKLDVRIYYQCIYRNP